MYHFRLENRRCDHEAAIFNSNLALLLLLVAIGISQNNVTYKRTVTRLDKRGQGFHQISCSIVTVSNCMALTSLCVATESCPDMSSLMFM